jgi:hypothetical protein
MLSPISFLMVSGPLSLAFHFAPVGHADPCTALFDAMAALVKVPVSVMTSINGKLPPSASIVTGGQVYIQQLDGTWRSLPHPMAGEEAKVEKARTDKTATCRQEPDAMVNGESTVVYFGRLTTAGSPTDNRLWVSKRTGLPLKAEMRIGDGPPFTSTYTYDHVHAPEGVVTTEAVKP